MSGVCSKLYPNITRNQLTWRPLQGWSATQRVKNATMQMSDAFLLMELEWS